MLTKKNIKKSPYVVDLRDAQDHVSVPVDHEQVDEGLFLQEEVIEAEAVSAEVSDTYEEVEFTDPEPAYSEVYASRHEDLREGGVELKSLVTQAVERHRGLGKLLFSVIAFIGWLFEQVVLGALSIVKLAKALLVSPISVLNALLDSSAKGARTGARVLATRIRHGWDVLKELRISPPRAWYRQIAVFSGLAILLILPVKFSDAGVKLFEAREKVLGSSTTVVKYAALSQALKEYVPAISVAKEFAGFNGPRRFLIVSQNNAELRPTGGFMGWFGVLDIHNGKITAFDTPDGGFYDLKSSITRQIEAPEPFHIFSPFWQVWNTNWFADYPTSARKLAHFYEISGGSTVDGVVMLTPNVIEEVLKLTGPIALPEYDQIIDHINFRTETQREVEIEYDREENTPKAFINDLMPELIVRIVALIEHGETEQLLSIIDSALVEKHALMYTTNASVQETVEELGWSGSLQDVPQDFLSVVHTNIGGGKTDIAIKDAISIDSEFREQGSIINTVSITRTHEGDPDHEFEGHNNLDYLRFYVPKGSILLSAEGFTTDDLTERYKTTEQELEQDLDLASSYASRLVDPVAKAEVYEETGKTVIAGWLGLKPGQKKTVTVTYRLPHSFSAGEPYSLYWQKQSGTQGTPFSASVTLPYGHVFENWLPQSANVKMVGESKVMYTNDLSRDRVLSFTIAEE